MKYFLVVSLSLMICLAHCKFDIDEVDEFEEFEESPRTVPKLKLKDDSIPILEKPEAEVTVEVYSNQRLPKMGLIVFMMFFFDRTMTNLSILTTKRNSKVLTLKDYMSMTRILR